MNYISNRFKQYYAKRQLKPYYKQVARINALQASLKTLSDEDLVAKTAAFKDQLANGSKLDDLLVEAFAVVREAADRVLGMRHFDIQLIGGMILHNGMIAEMKTGEGKTLVGTLPAYLNALSGQGVYIVTVNDYLAKRDCAWMGQIFQFLGLSVGLIQADLSPQDRLKAYGCDITYGTNNEFGFDYLRDHLATQAGDYCQRRRHFAIIDEIDSILIDEARTPLIISGSMDSNAKQYATVMRACRKLSLDDDFTCDTKHKNIVLTESGAETLEKKLKLDSLFSLDSMQYAHMAVQCLKALTLFKKDVDYVIKDGQVVIVDEFTGRLMDGRRYSDGLHQAIEAAEGLKIQQESQTLASITFQNYFRMFPKLCGMTGTAVTEAGEFTSIYGLSVLEVPPNRPLIRQDSSDQVYKTKASKYKAIIQQIESLHAEKRPVLVGTIAIETSELLSKALKKAGIPHHVLNAKQHGREASIIAKAGEAGAVTIATNMAGRGTDIKLGEGVIDSGGLAVIGTERHESRRIDNQLRGRSGRQGDPGSSVFYVSLDDDLMRLFGSDRLKTIMGKLGMADDVVIENGLINRSIAKAQHKIEQYHFSVRKQVLQYDDVLNQQRTSLYAIRDRVLLEPGLIIYIKQFIKALAEADLGLLSESLSYDLSSEAEPVTIAYRHLMKHYKACPEDIFNAIIKHIIITTVDRQWVDHLYSMDTLREGIGLRAWGQKDPLVEYKKEAYSLFQSLLKSIRFESLKMLMTVKLTRNRQLLP